MAALFAKLFAFVADRKANVAIIYALAVVPLALATGAGLDYARGVVVRACLADALDAAGLAVGGTPNLSQDAASSLAQSYFNANYTVDASYGTPTPVVVTQNGQDYTLTSTVTMPTVLLKLAGIQTLPVAYTVTITRSSKNLEVALALDTTGSMTGSRLTDLQSAAKDLIDTVVQDSQSPTYSKVALAPYTNAVNVGSYAAQVRGAAASGKAITGATKANPVVITAAGHGFANGDYVYISGVSGMTQLNGNTYMVANKTTNTFALYNVDGRNYYSYSGGGNAYCTTAGCQYYRFTSATGSTNVFAISSCASEHTTNAYTDTAPSTTLLGRVYPASNNPCINQPIIPLTSDRTVLETAVSNLSASGSTAGHIGTAWAWYLLSPNFAYLFSGEGQASAYGAANTMKFAVIMTDGAYNTPYCNGVISKDALSGSGNSSDHANCNAPNGSSIAQATQVCSAMKTAGIVVYTVGFDVGTDQSAIDVLTNCATDSAHAFFPATGTDLKGAFHEIAQQITNLRVKS